MSPETKQALSNELKRVTSRKYVAWIAVFGTWAIFTGVFLRVCSRAVWMAYDAIMAGKPIVETTGALKIMLDAWTYDTGAMVLCTLIYMGSNLADKFIGYKFNNGGSNNE